MYTDRQSFLYGRAQGGNLLAGGDLIEGRHCRSLLLSVSQHRTQASRFTLFVMPRDKCAAASFRRRFARGYFNSRIASM